MSIDFIPFMGCAFLVIGVSRLTLVKKIEVRDLDRTLDDIEDGQANDNTRTLIGSLDVSIGTVILFLWWASL